MESSNNENSQHNENTRVNSNSEESSITLKKSTLWKMATFVFAGLFVISLFTGGFNLGGGNNLPTPTGNVVAPTGDIKVSITNADPLLGDKNAKIKIVEFSDFQCPFCERVETGAIAEFKNSDYFKNGEVALVYKHFPLNSIHPFAQKAAEASVCAQNQGKFWEYHDLLFANQQSLDITSLKNYAKQVGLNQAKFDSCLDGGEAVAKVKKDLAEASTAGGQGTPYFVLINEDGDTQAVSGAVPWANFEVAIQSLQ
ncbi:hypothetical protein COU53_02480 [Candidatus Pacearchaeota archaeon CG10_big_fil_rev_8_21_14_0_10_30_48]|nr:MAG: hypothetical protein COU53_02480 [Candidatus Pacearchaeota archaeon CG10_big_fil_rev_8_21_14_0_10_30_48]